MKKLFITCTVLMLSIVAIFSFPASASSDQTYEGFTARGTVGDMPIIINGQLNKPVIDGCVLRSVNNTKGAKWRPLYSEINDLGPAIVKTSNKVALYTESFDVGRTGSTTATTGDTGAYDPNGATREEKILGMDLLVWKETYDPSSDKISLNDGGFVPTRESKHIDKLTAVEAIYKSVGSINYKANWYFRPHESGKAVVPVADTPLVTKVGDSCIGVNGKSYYCDVFVTRSVPDSIASRAFKEGVISDDPKIFVNDAMTQMPECKVNKELSGISVGEFCVYLKRALEVTGEPVYTEAETQQWLIEYGQSLPTTLSNLEYDAVKYLACRGIVDTSIDFNSQLSASDMLTILMRAKDTNSRLTFKKLEVTYDKNLVAKDFYPVNVSGNILNMTQPTLTLSADKGITIPDYFDYYIYKNDYTTFTSISGTASSSLFVAGDYKQLEKRTSETVLTSKADVKYLGVEDGYYHFQIPRIISSSDLSFEQTGSDPVSGYYYITTPSSTAKPGYIKVPFGGGRYTAMKVDNGNPVFTRDKFADTDDKNLMDIDRYTAAQNTVLAGKQLAKAYKSVFTFKCDAETLKNVYWKGKPLNDAGNNNEVSISGDTCTITITAVDPTSVLSRYLSTRSVTKNETMYPSYVCDSNNKVMLVPSTFFKSSMAGDNTISGIASISTGVYKIVTKSGTIYVDTAKKRIVSGQCVTELSSSDKSPLIVPLAGSTGEYYIDTRVLPIQTMNYLTTEDGTRCLELYSGKSATENRPVTPIMGNSMATANISVLKGSNKVILEGNYPQANFILYKQRSNSHGDFLLVFMPAEYGSVDAKTNSSIQSMFGIKVGANDRCVVYNLSKSMSVDNLNCYTTSAITYDSKNDLYIYNMPSISKWNINQYRQPTKGASNSFPLSLGVSEKDKCLYDLNFNVCSGVTEIPSAYVSITTSRAFGFTYGSGIVFGPTAKESSSAVDNGQMRVAPTAMQTLLVDVPKNTVDSIMGNRQTDAYIFYGGMSATLKHDTDAVKTHSLSYSLYCGDTTDGSKGQVVKLSPTGDYLYGFDYDTSFGTKNYIYVRQGEGVSTVAAYAIGSPESLALKATKGFFNMFNWGDFSFIESIQDADDILTIINIILLTVVPRIMTFIFFALLCLSIIAKYPITERFCDKFFDPYRILSFGRLDVHTVNTKELFISTFLATILLGMLTNQSLLDIFAYINRAFEGIVIQ